MDRIFLAITWVCLIALVLALALGPFPRAPRDYAAAKTEQIVRQNLVR
jgi:hypothetical protein